MRPQAVRDRRARPAAYRRLTSAAASGRTVTLGVLAVAACLPVLAACASQSPPGAPPAASSAASSAGTGSPAAGGTAACVTSQLKISLTHTGALAGQAGGYLQFTNHSGAPCLMSGWPAVIGLTATGQATRLRHLRSSMFGAWQDTSPSPVVTLRPGDSAYAIVAADDKPAGTSTRCPAPYVRLRVSPPGDPASVTISAWLPGAASDLPACAAADGSPTAGTSTMTTLSRLPH